MLSENILITSIPNTTATTCKITEISQPLSSFRPGKMYPESICIQGVDVRGTPAVRFVTLPKTTSPTVGPFLQLIVVTKVSYDALLFCQKAS